VRVAVSGAAGHLGGLVAELLIERIGPDKVIAISRRPESLKSSLGTSGVEVRRADFDDPDSLPGAFEGAERAFIISTNPIEGGQISIRRFVQHKNAITGARAAGVRHVVFPSMPRVDSNHPSGPHAQEYAQTEQFLRDSDVDWTFLQNAPYAEGQVMRAALAVSNGELTSNAGSGRNAPVTHLDCADVAAAILAGEGHEGRCYVVTGPRLFSQAELADLIADVCDRPVRLREVQDSEHAAELARQGLPEPYPQVLTNHLKAVRLGYFADCTPVVEELCGRPAQDLRGVMEAHREEILSTAATAS
jgi:NAD(P)H dehydrogenase (quinone)